MLLRHVAAAAHVAAVIVGLAALQQQRRTQSIIATIKIVNRNVFILDR